MYNQIIEQMNTDHYPWSDWMLFVLYVFSIFLALTSNSIILIIFYKKKKTKSATYQLMTNMAISDLLSGFLLLFQWCFCSRIFFPDQQSALPINDQSNNTELFLDLNSSSFNNLSNSLPVRLSINLPTSEAIENNYEQIDKTLQKSINKTVDKILDNILETNLDNSEQIKFSSNKSNESILNRMPNQVNSLKSNEIAISSNLPINERLKNSRIDLLKSNYIDNKLNNQKVNNQLFNKTSNLSSHDTTMINLINAKIFKPNLQTTNDQLSKQKINLDKSNNQKVNNNQLNNHQNNHQGTSNYHQFNVRTNPQTNQYSLIFSNRIEKELNHRSQQENLLTNLNKENIRKKRNLNQQVSTNEQHKIAKHAEINFESPEKSIQEHQTVTKSSTIHNEKKSNSATNSRIREKFKSFVNQVLNSDKSQFINHLPNCGQRICAILETLQMSSYYTSTLTMAGIAYNRYNLINRPLNPKMDTALFIITIWLTSLSMAFLASLSSLRIFVFFGVKRFIDCRIILASNDSWNLRKWRAIILMIVQYILPLSCILFLYIKVIKELKKCGGLVRTKHQSSTSSNNLSFDYSLKRRFSNPFVNYSNVQNGTINRSFIDQDIFKISLDEKTEMNNIENLIENDLKLDSSNNLNEIKPNSIKKTKFNKFFKFFNLVNFACIFSRTSQQPDDLSKNNSKSRSSVKNDCHTERDFLSNCNQNDKLNNQLAKVMMNAKITNSKLIMSKRPSNDSFTTFSINRSNSQSVSAKLNLLDDELDRTKRRLTKMMITVVLLFAIAWLPVHVSHLKQFLIDSYEDVNYNYCNSSFIYLFFYWIAFSTNTYNPLVYMYFSKELRKEAVIILKLAFSIFKVKNLLKRANC